MRSRRGGRKRIGGRTCGVLLATLALMAVPGNVGAASPNGSASAADSSRTIRAGESGKEFRSMTVEGEDRVHVDFARPELTLNLDPEDVPGLTRGTALDVLDRTVPDLAAPFIALSGQERSPYVARPWL